MARNPRKDKNVPTTPESKPELATPDVRVEDAAPQVVVETPETTIERKPVIDDCVGFERTTF